jgi:hypothetical protein
LQKHLESKYPANFLIDENMKIVAIDLQENQLENELTINYFPNKAF